MILAACLAALAFAAWNWRADPQRSGDVGKSPGVASSAAQIALDPTTGELVRMDRRADSRTAVKIALTAAGIRCPDGSHLPLLNGVDSAPAIIRADEHGPLPPVIAIVVDDAGFEWYEHADGSMTTSRPQFVIDAAGQRIVQVVTLHTTGLPADGSIRRLPADRETR